MLSYRHGFHAGGWADVHKHVVLMLLLAQLRTKPTPFTVADTHAGDALYDLTSAEALKTREFEGGIGRILSAADPPVPLALYLDAVRAVRVRDGSATYPGSPALVRGCLRNDDRLIANELHPTAYDALAAWARGDRRIAVHRRDALEFLGWVATPRLHRGLVLIDPAYEVKAEYQDVPIAVAAAAKRWPRGLYVLWYPVLREERHRAMLASLATALDAAPGVDSLVSEIAPCTIPASGMSGSGVVVINPPWGFEPQVAQAGAWLADTLWAPGGGRHSLTWLSPGTRADAGRRG